MWYMIILNSSINVLYIGLYLSNLKLIYDGNAIPCIRTTSGKSLPTKASQLPPFTLEALCSFPYFHNATVCRARARYQVSNSLWPVPLTTVGSLLDILPSIHAYCLYFSTLIFYLLHKKKLFINCGGITCIYLQSLYYDWGHNQIRGNLPIREQ